MSNRSAPRRFCLALPSVGGLSAQSDVSGSVSIPGFALSPESGFGGSWRSAEGLALSRFNASRVRPCLTDTLSRRGLKARLSAANAPFPPGNTVEYSTTLSANGQTPQRFAVAPSFRPVLASVLGGGHPARGVDGAPQAPSACSFDPYYDDPYLPNWSARATIRCAYAAASSRKT